MSERRRFIIPKEHYAGLARFLRLSDQQFADLVAALQETSPTVWPQEFTSAVAARLGPDARYADEVVPVLFGLYRTWARDESSMPAFVDAVREAMEHSGSDDLKPPDGDWSAFSDRLRTLLSIEQPLGTVAKAGHLAVSFDHTLHSAELFTDLRPVFGSDAEEPPVAAFVRHHLKVVYHDGSGLDDFYVALDDDDLEAMRAAIVRAQSKSKSLKGILDPLSVTVLKDKAS